MFIKKIPPRLYFLLIFIFLLTACTPAQITPTLTDVENTAIAAEWTDIAFTQAITSTLVSTPTILPTETPALTATPTSLPLYPQDGFRRAYTINGNLYLQDSGKEQIQLTDSGEDRSPNFSDDGEKIVFFRGRLSQNTYSINADGSQEQALITGSLLADLGLGYSETTELYSLAFVPGTHLLLFNTFEPGKSRRFASDGLPNLDLLLVDTDATKIRKLLAPAQGGPFKVSLDGKLVAVQTAEHIDVIDLDGNFIRRKLITYPRAWAFLITPDIYWTQNSSKLSIAPPSSTGALDYTGPEPNKIWQYSIDDDQRVEINTNPPLMQDFFSISPDGNWVIYNFHDPAEKTNLGIGSGLYIANLRDGTFQLFDVGELQIGSLPFDFYWSPNNTHFVFEGSKSRLFMGSIDGELTPLAKGLFLCWIDKSRYAFSNTDGVTISQIDKEEKTSTSEKTVCDSSYYTFIFVKHEKER